MEGEENYEPAIPEDDEEEPLTWLEWMEYKLASYPTGVGGVFAHNLFDWAEDIVDELGSDITGIQLRRAIINELNEETVAAGDWSLWLSHFWWVMLKRADEAKNVAPKDWKSFMKEAIGLETHNLSLIHISEPTN